MAIEWNLREAGKNYEVRRAGRSLRLYTDGVFHSQYNPGRPLTGSVWDLLSIPAFLLEPERPLRVLVLGVGGGAVLRQLEHFFQVESICGVELNPVHLDVARRFFGLNTTPYELYQADAVQWLWDYRGPSFDYIVDDLYGEQDGEPCRAVAVDSGWARVLIKHLSPQGILVMNFIGREELAACAFMQAAWSKRLATRMSLSHPGNENRVAVFSRHAYEDDALRTRLKEQPEIARALQSGLLQYHRRPL